MAFSATDLPSTLRNRSGSALLGQMRREGLTPAVYYGKETENMNLKVDTKTLVDTLRASASENILVNLKVEDEGEHLALIQEVQHEPLSGQILHVDFLAVTQGQSMSAPVPLVFEGTAKGVKAGGTLSQQLTELTVSCLPKDLPESILIDVTGLEVGESLTVADLAMPEGVSTDVDGQVVIAHLSAPTLAEETTGEEAPAEAESTDAASE